MGKTGEIKRKCVRPEVLASATSTGFPGPVALCYKKKNIYGKEILPIKTRLLHLN
jgi:hypothetical protein